MINVWRIARRELRGGLRGFRVFLACLALGVGAIAAVGSIASSVIGGLEIRMSTSKAPALRTISTIFTEVVPRTMESSTRTTRFPLRCAALALCLSRTPRWRIWSVGSMKVRPT